MTPAARAVARWAVRLFRREWRQQVLVLALLTVAVGAAMFMATAAYNIGAKVEADFGSANGRIRMGVSDPEALGPYLAAAEEWFGTIDVIGHRSVAVPGAVDRIELRSQEPSGLYGAPMLALRAGRYPATDGEVALTDRVATVFGVGVGDMVGIGGDERTVVGLVENPAALDEEFALIAPSAAEPVDSVTVLVSASDERVRDFRPAEEPGSGFVESLGQDEDATARAVLVLVVATVAMLLLGLLAAAGFVVVAHRRQRQLGMLAAVGATERHLRLVMLVNGVVVGVIAAGAGAALALVAWLSSATSLEGPAGHRIDRFTIPWWTVAVGVCLAVVTASAAAWWPARSIARVPIVNALSARPPRPRPAHRPAVVAILLLAVSVFSLSTGIDPSRDYSQPALAIVGVLAAVAAIVFIALPAIRALAAMSGRLPLAVRLPLRDLARFPARSGAALGAVTLGVAIAVSTVIVAAAAEYDADEGNLSDRQLIVWTGTVEEIDILLPLEVSPGQLDRVEGSVASIAGAVGAPLVVPLDLAVDPTVEEPFGSERVRLPVHQGRRISERSLRDAGRLFVATPELLRYLGFDGTAVDQDTLVLTTLDEDVYLAGAIANDIYRRNPIPDAAVQRVDLPPHASLPHALITERGLQAADLVAMRAGWLVEASTPLTASELSDARSMAAEAGLTIESREEQGGLVTIRSSATIAGVLLAVGILAMTVGLIRGESAADLRTLTAAGASRGVRRLLTAATAASMAMLAAVLAIGIAYLALSAGYWPDEERLANVPVANMVAITVGLPIFAGAVGWLLAGREPAAVARTAIE